ncbi:hypothetical protein APHAL10511_003216 [Amanita phalloides]|nr:hypothetical protein APHAL10511_003216 [Amanita phalloides]
MSATSAWLTGAPLHSRPLIWPSDDQTIRARRWDREGTSLLNGLILYWLGFTRENTKRTVVYLAGTRLPGSGLEINKVDVEAPLVLSRIAKELDYAVDRIALVGSDEFVSAVWGTSARTLNLRLHTLDGSLIRNDSISVHAAYGDLRVFGRKVCICVSSGPTNALDAAITPGHLRLGSDTDNAAEPAEGLFADQILEWDLTSGVFRRINIPDPVWHSAEYTYPSEGRVSLACLFDQQDPQDQLALQCFNFDDQPDNKPQPAPRFFSAGSSSSDRLLKGAGIGIEGSTKASDVIVHSFDRIAVYSRAFLNTEVADNPRTGRLHFISSLLPDHEVRILPFALPSSQLPAICNNRVLVYNKIARKYYFHVLDFDEQRVKHLLRNTFEQRENLRAELQLANARVKIVTRQFYAQEEGVIVGGNSCVDKEYPRRGVPSEWWERLKVLANEEKESEGKPSLIFDEAPLGRREGRWGYVQSELRLGKEVSSNTVGRMGITDGCIVLIPEPEDSGIVWYFE